MSTQDKATKTRHSSLLSRAIFSSRWLQLPLYLGLIAAQAVYVFHFWVELVHLLEAAFGNQNALQALISSIGYKADTARIMFVARVIKTLIRWKPKFAQKNLQLWPQP
jgi:uncharacterized protein (TIGR00645 family)